MAVLPRCPWAVRTVFQRLMKTVHTGRGAWFMANTSTVNAGLRGRTLRRYGLLMPSDLAGV